MGIGVYFYFKSSNIEDYLLGGRGMEIVYEAPFLRHFTARFKPVS